MSRRKTTSGLHLGCEMYMVKKKKGTEKSWQCYHVRVCKLNLTS